MKRILFIVVFLSGFAIAHAQDTYNSSGTNGNYYKKHAHKNKGFDPSKLVLGCGLNADYSTDYADFGISPFVGYQFAKDFTAGVGVGYQYSMQPQWNVSYNNDIYHMYENTFYPSLWAKYRFFRNWYFSASLEQDFISVKQYDLIGYDPYGNEILQQDVYKVNATCLLVGVGIRQPLGGRAALFIEVLYDVLQEQYSPYYGQPILRAGVAAGL